MSNELKKTIDRMVEDAIRRVLPTIMNEVLLKTIANAGVIQERREQTQVERRPTKPAARKVQTAPQPRQKIGNLRELLGDSASSGADFYDDPRAAHARSIQEESYDDDGGEEMHEDIPPLAQRIRQLPPALQAMTEGMNLDIDAGEMWGDESDSASSNVEPPSIPLDRAAKAVGLDFTRMAGVIQKTAPKQHRVSGADAAAKIQFEEQRIARDREALNRKP